jgi:hypothetical protein
MYLTLGIGVIQSMLEWNRLVANAAAVGGAGVVLFIQVFAFAVMVLLIWLVARRRKNWARWLMLAMFLAGTPSAVRITVQTFQIIPISAILYCVQWALEIVAFWLIFTGNAREWFRPSESIPPNPA